MCVCLRLCGHFALKKQTNKKQYYYYFSYNVSTSSLSTVEAQSFMTLHSLTSQATGIYRCEAQNSQGTVHNDIGVYRELML